MNYYFSLLSPFRGQLLDANNIPQAGTSPALVAPLRLPLSLFRGLRLNSHRPLPSRLGKPLQRLAQGCLDRILSPQIFQRLLAHVDRLAPAVPWSGRDRRLLVPPFLGCWRWWVLPVEAADGIHELLDHLLDFSFLPMLLYFFWAESLEGPQGALRSPCDSGGHHGRGPSPLQLLRSLL